MNDWYNHNENRCYPFKENQTDSLPKKEIVDCHFFLKNASSNHVYLQSREEHDSDIVYTFHTNVGNFEFTVPKPSRYQVIWVYESFGYGFCVFGDITKDEE